MQQDRQTNTRRPRTRNNKKTNTKPQNPKTPKPQIYLVRESLRLKFNKMWSNHPDRPTQTYYPVWEGSQPIDGGGLAEQQKPQDRFINEGQ